MDPGTNENRPNDEKKQKEYRRDIGKADGGAPLLIRHVQKVCIRTRGAIS